MRKPSESDCLDAGRRLSLPIHRSAWKENSAKFGRSGGRHDLPVVGLKRQLLGYGTAPKPLPVAPGPWLAQLLRFPLGDRYRRRRVRDHKPVTDEAGLAPEDPHPFGVYLAKRLPTLLGVEVDVPPTDGATHIHHSSSSWLALGVEGTR